MPVTDFLDRNARMYPNEVALVELNPDEKDTRRTTWKEYDLIQPDLFEPYRREITWGVFNEKANRFANMLIGRGVKKGEKVAILMYNCLEWLPIYFGVLKCGALPYRSISVMMRVKSCTAQNWRKWISSYSVRLLSDVLSPMRNVWQRDAFSSM